MLFLLSLSSRPRFPLFPYTTLFRSGNGAGVHARIGRGDAGDPDIGQTAGADVLHHEVHASGFAVVQELVAVAAFQDRKSTRLNSSHLVISYAVFCLKKKKLDINTTA